MTTANWILWGICMGAWFGIVLPLYIRHQDRKWKDHYARLLAQRIDDSVETFERERRITPD